MDPAAPNPNNAPPPDAADTSDKGQKISQAVIDLITIMILIDQMDRDERIDRRIEKRKKLLDDANEAKEDAVKKIAEAKEARRKKEAEPPSTKPLDEQMIDNVLWDEEQKARADAAREALKKFREREAKAQWWAANAAEAGDQADVKARMNEEAVNKARADEAARVAKREEDFKKDREEYAKQEAAKQQAKDKSDEQVKAQAEKIKQGEQDKADARRLEDLEQQLGSRPKAEEALKAEKAAEAKKIEDQKKSEKLQDLAKKGGVGGDLAGAVDNVNRNNTAIEGAK